MDTFPSNSTVPDVPVPEGQAPPAQTDITFGRTPFIGKHGIISWRILGGVFAALLVVGWVFIVVILIQEEKWQLVLVAWLLLYAAAHFCYWYFKRHHLLSLHSQICRRVRTESSSSAVRPMEKTLDSPPSYDDVIKSEPPPPTYCSLTVDTPKSTPNKKFTIFSFESLPHMFSKSTPSQSGSTPNKSGPLLQSHPPIYSTPTSASSGVGSSMWKSFEYCNPPSYEDSVVDVESQTIDLEGQPYLSRPYTRRGSRSVLRSDSATTAESITPILAPIHRSISDRARSPLPHYYSSVGASGSSSSDTTSAKSPDIVTTNEDSSTENC